MIQLIYFYTATVYAIGQLCQLIQILMIIVNKICSLSPYWTKNVKIIKPSTNLYDVAGKTTEGKT